MLKFVVLTLFPEMIRSYINESIIGRGVRSGKLSVDVIDIREHADGPYRKTDDYAYAGGGMVMMAEPLDRALESAARPEERYVIYPSPQGVPLHQELVEELRKTASSKVIVIVCGHYEGIDERFISTRADKEISLGDFVLTGGELPAIAMIDAIARLIDGVVGKGAAVRDDSFFNGMLDHPHYTRPREWDGLAVPEELLDGDAASITAWRKREAVRRTLERRPDMLSRASIMPYLAKDAYVILLHHPVLDRRGQLSTTAVTGLDVHDISRACRTYGVKKFIIVNPLAQQREIVKKIISHWTEGWGADACPDRRSAVERVKTFASYRRALEWIAAREGAEPFTVATTASVHPMAEHWLTIKSELVSSDRPPVLLFGTGYGLHPKVLDAADRIASPIRGATEYDHLSVRSAVSIALDRLFGSR